MIARRYRVLAAPRSARPVPGGSWIADRAPWRTTTVAATARPPSTVRGALQKPSITYDVDYLS